MLLDTFKLFFEKTDEKYLDKLKKGYEKKMAGNRAGGLKAKKTNKQKHGSDFYKVIGSKGGKASKTGGFFANRELASRAGKKGGQISRRRKATDK